MSRRHAGGHVLPENPTWIEFSRSDGNASLLPKNTTRIVDEEGQVNYMRPVGLEESLAIMWRVSIGTALAAKMGKPEGGKYVLKSWPAGYQFFDHNKGPAKAPRHDAYLCGSKNVNRFRSTNEFIPHALWLLTDETMNRANCQCKYCAKTPQRVISDNMGLSARRSASVSAVLPPSVARHPRARRDGQRERRPERAATKPFAAVRRAPKPPKLLVRPTQYISPERDQDIRTSISYIPGQSTRRYRKLEIVWCHLNPPIRGRIPEEDITFWPGLVEDARVGCHPILVAVSDQDVNMTDLYAEAQDGNVQQGESSGDPSAVPSGPPPNMPIEAQGRVPWRVEQWYTYRVKFLGSAYGTILRDDEILPYLAYAPSDQVLSRVQEELDAYLKTVPIDQMDRDLERFMFDFHPTNNEVPSDQEGKYRHAAAPYTLAIQIASNVAQYWLPTDDWECTFTLPTPTPPPTAIPRASPTSPQPQSLHSVIQQSLSNNAMSHGASNGTMAEPESISMVGRPSRALSARQSVVQMRFQGLWWGTERIWTDELVRLKIARSQFAPQGTDTIRPPAGPSARTLEFVKATNPDVADIDLQTLGAGPKGLFLRLEGLVVVDVPVENGGVTNECRASGMLYELVDEDWEEEVPANAVNGVNGKGKGKARAEPEAPMPMSQDPGDQALMSQPSPLKPPPLPNPDPTVPVSETASAILSQTSPAAAATTAAATASASASSSQKARPLDTQLSHPVHSTPYPLPPAPKGFKFRAILPPEHEVVVSLSLISGRYYPGLLHHPLLRETVERGMQQDNMLQHKDLWALDGLSPGVHQSMDPRSWRTSRPAMFQDADKEARDRFKERWEETKMARLHPEAGSVDEHMDVD